MTKQELAHIAKVIYDLQEYCKINDCQLCPANDYWGCCLADTGYIPQFWGITKADIERLKRIEGELRVKVPVEWLKSAVQANKELERENNESN